MPIKLIANPTRIPNGGDFKGKGGEASCEYLAICPFLNDSTYGMPEMFKERYCKGDYRRCGRYFAFKAEERTKKTKRGRGFEPPTPLYYP